MDSCTHTKMRTVGGCRPTIPSPSRTKICVSAPERWNSLCCVCMYVCVCVLYVCA